jgi:hypothetical protein
MPPVTNAALYSSSAAASQVASGMSPRSPAGPVLEHRSSRDQLPERCGSCSRLALPPRSWGAMPYSE